MTCLSLLMSPPTITTTKKQGKSHRALAGGQPGIIFCNAEGKHTWMGFRWIIALTLKCNYFFRNEFQVPSLEEHTLPSLLGPSANGAGRIMPTHQVKPVGSPHHMAQAPFRKDQGCFLSDLGPGPVLLPELLSHLHCFWPHLPPIHLPTFKQARDDKADITCSFGGSR